MEKRALSFKFSFPILLVSFITHSEWLRFIAHEDDGKKYDLGERF
jgi:hypothetical protein